MNHGEAKLEAAVALLSAGAASTGQLSLAVSVKAPPPGYVPAHVKLLESEAPRALRILETGVVLRGIQSQLAGLLFACARLRAALAAPEGSALLRRDQDQEQGKERGAVRAVLCAVDEDEEAEAKAEEAEEEESWPPLSSGRAPSEAREEMEREMAALLAALDSPLVEVQ